MMKQRLVGAAVLIALGVIFIPMFLTGEGNFLSGNVESNVPPKPMYELEAPKVLPLDKRALQPSDPVPETAANAQSSPDTQTADQSGAADSNVVKENTDPVVAESPASTTEKSNTDISESSSVAADSKVVAKPADKNETAKSATDARSALSTSSSTTSSSKGSVAISGKSAATTTAPTPIKSPDKPTVVAKAETDTKPIVSGWVVQLGSFSVEKNAVQLRDSLRKKGHASFVEEYTHNGKTSYRVRVGPELTRELANELKKTLKTETKIDGFVVAFSGK